MRLPCPARPAGRAFTLIELLTAVVIFGIVLTAINTVFYGAFRLRTRVTETLDEKQSLNVAMTLLRHDLQNIVPPGALLAGPFIIGPVSTSPNTAQRPGIEFCNTGGVIDDNAPWGDLQKVIYQLREPLDRSHALGRDLVRYVTRNLLATTMEEPVEQRLLHDVETLEFLGLSGQDWRPSWDTTLTDTNLPTAVRVRIQLASRTGGNLRGRQPLELLVPLVVQGGTNQTQMSGGGQ